MSLTSGLQEQSLLFSRQEGLPKHESRAPGILGVNIGLFLFASIFLFARIYSRILIRSRWRADDYFIFISWLLYLPYTILACLQTRYGAGQHAIYVPLTNLQFLGISSYVCAILYSMYEWTIKMSIALLYLRVFAPVTLTRNLIYGLIAIILIYGWTFVFLMIFQCHPISAAWGPRGPDSHCIDARSAFVASAVVSICIDLTLIIIVIPRVMGLNISKAQKFALMAVVNLGWVSIMATILRAIELHHVVTLPDFTWNLLDFLAWTALELSTAMICASAPVIRPLLKKCTLLKEWMGSLSSEENSLNSAGTGWTDPTLTGHSEMAKSITVGRSGHQSIALQSVIEDV